ncbi:dipeptidase [Pseudogracilibacillus sp. SO30301A]|uniref:dipeptidase n=1 Tax=Pseudogracilibacillus sp. SO30301A TaxID=3098291 RepID=UPI00300DD4FD
MKVVDLHSDLFNDIAFRRGNGERNVLERVHLPNLKRGRVAGLIGVIWVEPIYQNKLKRFLEIFHHVLDDLNESSEVIVVRTPDEMLHAYETEKFFVYLGIEGVTFIEEWTGNNKKEKVSLAFNELNENSIRHSIFTWNEVNFIASGSGNEKNVHSGISKHGEGLIQQMIDENWIIDVSHLDEQSFWDVVNQSNYPLLASHSNVNAICFHERNLTDEQINAIAKTEGLIGVNAYGSFVHPTEPTIDRFIDHICYIAELVGIEYVGLGFDFVDYLQSYDLGSDLSNLTVGLEDATKIPKLLEKLSQRGFSSADIEKLAFRNFYQFMCNIHKYSRGKNDA